MREEGEKRFSKKKRRKKGGEKRTGKRKKGEEKHIKNASAKMKSFQLRATNACRAKRDTCGVARRYTWPKKTWAGQKPLKMSTKFKNSIIFGFF